MTSALDRINSLHPITKKSFMQEILRGRRIDAIKVLWSAEQKGLREATEFVTINWSKLRQEALRLRGIGEI